MANIIHKLTRNKSTLRIFKNLPKPTPSLTNTSNPIIFVNPTASENDNSIQSFRFYPSFPFGYCLNPISSTGFCQLNAIDAGVVETDNDATTVWADSVKKKRKKKMNKHKYKKLRKRLRRKT
ncbi:DUF1713 domain-containing protein [Citrus sinensis]|uniref:Small ribosomal subunit protein mS38 n=1 Tax=Citrus clementina TaxID=85681 RepID=V4TTK4_CITCL|nr:uncharacterized protein LOC18047588 [Citrus x clementina]XP_006476930.2 uncharacterized protein LOC102610389 [Citrus sinensis]ESR53221.1 hypothetical protein CICLE_v10022896mg [Citrus x clementina]KAH9720570.1 DUF1713 domain-containing protein [Citrus sinensis]